MKRLVSFCIWLWSVAFVAALAPAMACAEISGNLNLDVVSVSESVRDLRIGLKQFEQKHVWTIEEKHEKRE